MLRISTDQTDVLRSSMLESKADAFLESLLSDFPKQLADRNVSELRWHVRDLITQFFDLGFREGQHLYRLVAWAVFLGGDFLETHCHGKPFDIAREDAPEVERFRQIRAMLVADALSANRQDEERWPS